MQEVPLFERSFITHESLPRRLLQEFKTAAIEFKQDPRGYLRSAFKGSTQQGADRRASLLKLGGAIALIFYVLIFAGILVIWFVGHRTSSVQEVADVHWVNPHDFEMQKLEMPKANKKAGGGGGGGRNTSTPASKGQLPKFSLAPPIIAPRPEPTLKPPALVLPETVQVDPKLEPKRIDDLPTGLPTGVPGPPSAGPGSGGGMGTGAGGGMGPGDGTGVGPGRGYNTGGGDPNVGGGTGTGFDSRPIALNAPQPRYTEEARKSKIQGTVLVRVLVGIDGTVKKVVVTRGLPDGLSEKAIEAAYQLKFKPATKNGQPVASWVNAEVEFNLR